MSHAATLLERLKCGEETDHALSKWSPNWRSWSRSCRCGAKYETAHERPDGAPLAYDGVSPTTQTWAGPLAEQDEQA